MDNLSTPNYGLPAHNITCFDGRSLLHSCARLSTDDWHYLLVFVSSARRCLGCPKLQYLWSVSVLSAGKCDRALQHIQLRYGSGPREVRLLRRFGVGHQLQHLHWGQFYPKEKRPPETREEGVDAGRYFPLRSLFLNHKLSNKEEFVGLTQELPGLVFQHWQSAKKSNQWA